MSSVTARTLIVDTMAGPVPAADIAIAAIKARQDGVAEICLVGNLPLLEETIRQQGGNIGDFDFVHAPSAIGRRENGDRAPKLKPDSSLSKALSLAASEQTAVVSFGNARALRRMVHAQYATAGRLCPFVTVVPHNELLTTILDVGPHALTSPRHLTEFAHIGAAFHSLVQSSESTSVALLSGETAATNCSETLREAHRLMNSCTSDYRGLRSGREWIERPTDVAVTTADLGLFLAEYLRETHRRREQEKQTDRGISWTSLFRKSPVRKVTESPLGYLSSAVLGADRLVVHRRHVLSAVDVYRTLNETAHLLSLEVVSHVNAALTSIENESLRTTLEVPARTVS